MMMLTVMMMTMFITVTTVLTMMMIMMMTMAATTMMMVMVVTLVVSIEDGRFILQVCGSSKEGCKWPSHLFKYEAHLFTSSSFSPVDSLRELSVSGVIGACLGGTGLQRTLSSLSTATIVHSPPPYYEVAENGVHMKF